LTRARWQILGTIVAADRPQPVAWLARDLGANRQNVQRIVDDLAKEGLVGLSALRRKLENRRWNVAGGVRKGTT
jgi:DNA-binding MarR family transcriptional regulator